ncbi:MAG: 16S rRNA (cytosine(1402)-N(4))-methyltransferase RsmH [Chitinophagales bacterium]
MLDTYHIPVMLEECVAAMAITQGQNIVDACYGGGGHARAFLAKLGHSGKLIAFDQDSDAQKNAINAENFVLIQQNFRYLQKFLRLMQISQVNAVFADLGVSSYQINTPERGFSFRFDAPLDMRMNTAQSVSAADILQKKTVAELADIFYFYGEVPQARKFADFVVVKRQQKPVVSTFDLKMLIDQFFGNAANAKLYAQVFQALRIEVNEELAALEAFLEQSAQVLVPGGRLVVLTYHSLEDRIVKRFMKFSNFSTQPDKDMYGNTNLYFKPINTKPILPQAKEIKQNSRARSAKLRIAQRI